MFSVLCHRPFAAVDFVYDNTLMDVEVDSQEVTTSNRDVTVTEDVTLSYGSARKKRATVINPYSLNLGNIVNPSSSGAAANISLLVSHPLLPLSTLYLVVDAVRDITLSPVTLLLLFV